MASESGAGGSGGAVGGGGAEADARAGGRDHALGTRYPRPSMAPVAGTTGIFIMKT